MARRISIYLSDAAEAAMQPADESVSGRINSILIRYDTIRREECPVMSEAEWAACCDVLNGAWLQAEVSELDPARYVWAEMADSPEMGEKWSLDHAALVAKLRALSYVQRVCVVEVATRFWKNPRLNEASIIELLREAGAAVREVTPT